MLNDRRRDQFLHFQSHVVQISERLIDAGKSNVRNFVDLAQRLHGVLTDYGAWHFGRAQAMDAVLDIASYGLDGFDR